MRSIIILLVAIFFSSCNTHIHIQDNRKDCFEVIEENDDTLSEGKLAPYIEDPEIEYDKRIINDCNDAHKLFFHFYLYVDTIINDTIVIKKIQNLRVIKEQKIIEYRCIDDVLKQLYNKTYICRDKRKFTSVSLVAVALKDTIGSD